MRSNLSGEPRRNRSSTEWHIGPTPKQVLAPWRLWLRVWDMRGIRGALARVAGMWVFFGAGWLFSELFL